MCVFPNNPGTEQKVLKELKINLSLVVNGEYSSLDIMNTLYSELSTTVNTKISNVKFYSK